MTQYVVSFSILIKLYHIWKINRLLIKGVDVSDEFEAKTLKWEIRDWNEGIKIFSQKPNLEDLGGISDEMNSLIRSGIVAGCDARIRLLSENLYREIITYYEGVLNPPRANISWRYCHGLTLELIKLISPSVPVLWKIHKEHGDDMVSQCDLLKSGQPNSLESRLDSFENVSAHIKVAFSVLTYLEKFQSICSLHIR